MQIKTFPHEFLARWGRDGSLQGYHVVPVQIACDDDGLPLKKDPANPESENLMEAMGEATTLTRANMTLEDLLNAVQAGALKSVDALRVELEAAQAETNAALGQLDAMTAERDALQAKVEQLQAALPPPQTTEGTAPVDSTEQ